ncbi:septal ring lytic transglycosylase RlpA family protein [Qipengyuania nanhaisediminis]|uniref:septal ring lytic transglycosylase RlpA family protein n=1 Tax=Qipengyuania nanhaisediminis TaxID=604088 RepID=UPI0038B2847F
MLALRAAMVALVSLAPLSASSAQQARTDKTPGDGGTAMVEVPFAAHFEAVIEPLGPDLQDFELHVPEHAVDLDSFEPPIEEIPESRSLGTGIASFYGRRFHGRLTANGERFDMRAMTAAHKTLPFGSLVRVTNPSNGRTVTVRINDRGPFIRGRTIDLSRGAAEELGIIRRGHARVEMELLSP